MGTAVKYIKSDTYSEQDDEIFYRYGGVSDYDIIHPVYLQPGAKKSIWECKRINTCAYGQPISAAHYSNDPNASEWERDKYKVLDFSEGKDERFQKRYEMHEKLAKERRDKNGSSTNDDDVDSDMLKKSKVHSFNAQLSLTDIEN